MHCIPQIEISSTGPAIQLFLRILADPTDGCVHNPPKRRAIIRVLNDPQIGNQVFDFRPFIERDTTGDGKRDAGSSESCFNGAGERVHAVKYGKV